MFAWDSLTGAYILLRVVDGQLGARRTEEAFGFIMAEFEILRVSADACHHYRRRLLR